MTMTDTPATETAAPARDRVDRTDPDAVWSDLVARHDEVAARLPHDGTPDHTPEVAVLACSDARVPPSSVFDATPGSMFVVRHAGNTASPTAVASLDYAVENLGVHLVVVLGHSECGAVTAAFAPDGDADLAPVVEPITAVVGRCGCTTVDEAVEANVAETVATLGAGDGPLGRAARRGDVVIRGAVHDITTGALRPVTLAPDEHPNDSVATDRSETETPETHHKEKQ